MDSEGSLLKKIAQSLAGLSEAELLNLESIVWDMQIQTHDELKGMQFYAEGVFSEEAIDREKLLFADITQEIGNLNPAEIRVLHTLLTWHLDKAHDHRDEHISTHWGTNHPGLSHVSNTTWSSGGFSGGSSSSFDPRSPAIKQFEAFTKLLAEMHQAKDAGDNERASNLLEEILSNLDKAGLPAYMKDRFRKLMS
jgi:hypothetical protein